MEIGNGASQVAQGKFAGAGFVGCPDRAELEQVGTGQEVGAAAEKTPEYGEYSAAFFEGSAETSLSWRSASQGSFGSTGER